MPLTMQDLEPGDILITQQTWTREPSVRDWFVHLGIRFGQTVASFSRKGHAKSVHAAIFLVNDLVAEAEGNGLEKNHLTDGRTVLVYRYRDQSVAMLAAHTASQWTYENAAGQKGHYAFKNLVTSVFGLSKYGDKAQQYVNGLTNSWQDAGGSLRDMICSQFVISCYQAAAIANGLANPIATDAQKTTPKELENKLAKDNRWRKLGTFEVPR